MTLNIPPDIQQQIGPTERDALIEIACRLYDAEKILKPQATRLCGLSRVDFEAELAKRGLAVYHADPAEIDKDLAAVESQMRKAS